MNDALREEPKKEERPVPYAEIKRLFKEASAFVNQIRKTALFLHRDDKLLAAGQDILQTLQNHGPQTVPAIGRLHNSSRQNIQVLINRLRLEGCVEFGRNPVHRKSALVLLTAQGKDLLSNATEREAKLLENLSASISEGEVIAAAEFLRRIRRLLTPEERKGREASGNRKGRSRRQTVRRLPAAQPPLQPGIERVSGIIEESELPEGEIPLSML
jgi:DNA-binding MarR family transcriptional regulator